MTLRKWNEVIIILSLGGMGVRNVWVYVELCVESRD